MKEKSKCVIAARRTLTLGEREKRQYIRVKTAFMAVRRKINEKKKCFAGAACAGGEL